MVLGSASNKAAKPRHKAAHKHSLPSGVCLANQLPHGLGFGSGDSSSSHTVGHFFSTKSFGRRTLHQEVLHATAIQVRQDNDQVEYQDHHDSIPIDERSRLAHIRADEDQNYPEQEAEMSIHDILTGDSTADISHAGTEFAELLAIEDDLLGPVLQ
jgi:hypothetical protein